jgi:hypothetical protein
MMNCVMCIVAAFFSSCPSIFHWSIGWISWLKYVKFHELWYPQWYPMGDHTRVWLPWQNIVHSMWTIMKKTSWYVPKYVMKPTILVRDVSSWIHNNHYQISSGTLRISTPQVLKGILKFMTLPSHSDTTHSFFTTRARLFLSFPQTVKCKRPLWKGWMTRS